MNVLLVNPNRTSPRTELHLGLGYIASFLSKCGHAVTVIDTRIFSLEELVKVVSGGDYQLVGFTATTPMFKEASALAKVVKGLSPTTYVAIGGPHVSMATTNVLQNSCFDFAVYGEGEKTAAELVGLIERGDLMTSELTRIPGLIFQDNGIIVLNEPRPFAENLDDLPFPALHLFDLDRYGFHRMLTSRGCPFGCNYCLVNRIWSRQVRHRSVENIIAEIKHILQHHGYKVFAFSDDLFNFSVERTWDFCQALIDEGLNIIWTLAGIRLKNVTPELVTKMTEAGCSGINVGIQSINDGVLKNMERGESSEDIRRGLAILRQSVIPVWGQFMIGNIGDTLEAVRESVEFARVAGFRRVSFYSAIPFHGTKLWDYVAEHGSFLPKADTSCVSFYESPDNIAFVTPEFGYEDRREAIQLAIDTGFFETGGEKLTSSFDDFFYFRVLNGFLFRLFSNRFNQQTMRLLSRFRTRLLRVSAAVRMSR